MFIGNVGVAPGIAGGGHGVSFEGDVVECLKGGGECVVVGGGEAIVAVGWRVLFGCSCAFAAAVVIGFGEDAQMTGFAKDCPENTGDGSGWQGLFGFEIIVVGAGG